MFTRRLFALLLAVALLVGLMPMTAAPARAEENLKYWIGVDVANQRCTIYSTADNHVVHCWLCTTGASGTPTPQGIYHLPEARGSERKEWFAFTATWVKYAVRYTRGLYFHSVLFKKRDDNAMKLSTLRRLGHRGSAGCVRLEVAHAKFICDNCPTGTLVVIHKGVDDPRITGILGHSASIETTPSLPAPPFVTGLVLDRTEPVRLEKGQTLKLNCVVEPANAPTTLTWKSSKPKFVTVDNTGLVTAVGNGISTVSVTASNGVRTTVKVESVDTTIARSVSLSPAGPLTVNVGETLQLTATTDPSPAAKALTWKSSRTKYAAVDESGRVTGIAPGTAKITVLTSNRKRATVTVKVVDPYAPQSVSFDKKGPITMHVGETLTLTPVLFPGTARSAYIWSSSRKSVAQVNGGVITAVKKGKARITVKTANKKRATIVIKVVD